MKVLILSAIFLLKFRNILIISIIWLHNRRKICKKKVPETRKKNLVVGNIKISTKL